MGKKMRPGLFCAIVVPCAVVCLGIAIAIPIVSNQPFIAGILDTYIAQGDRHEEKLEGTEDWDVKYNKSEFKDETEAKANGEATVEEICNEGIVMLKNDGTLPLVSNNVTLLGRGSVDPVYGGSGSGNVNTATCATPKSALEKAGFTVNNDAYNFYKSVYGSYDKTAITMDNYNNSKFFIGEIPVSTFTFTPNASDTAVIVLSRGGGEGGDLSTDLNRDKGTSAAQNSISTNANSAAEVANYVAGQHQLELNKEEKDLVAFAETNYAKVVVVINSSNVMELGALKADAKINGILWVGSAGSTGFNSLGSILKGTVNPSGHTPDIYPADLTKDPSFKNFGMNGVNKYTGITSADDVDKGNANTYAAYFVEYEEGIYVGYKYYETAATEGYITYDDAVVYPFGYGLSYTTFTKEIKSKSTGDIIECSVEVKNTGSKAGKEVVQLYYTAPYTTGGIEKSSTVLGDFAKTKLLNPGESETVTLKIKKEDMASYDYKTEKAYVLDSGTYTFQIKDDSHNVTKFGGANQEFTMNQGSKVVYSEGRSSDKTAATNQFDDISAMFKDSTTSGYAVNMTRSNFAGTFPTTPTATDADPDTQVINGKSIRDLLKPFKAENDPSDEMPIMGEENGLLTIDLRGKDYDDETYDLLLNQLTDADYKAASGYLCSSAYNTPKIVSLVKPATVDHDGPQGFSVLWGGLDACAYMSEPLLAATFSKEMAKKMGTAFGEEGLAMGFAGVYAPGLNTHRSAFAGRNFEYYSEDGVLAGNIAQNMIEGASSKGLNCYMKHFALNDSEFMRTTNICTWANEQAIREIYLKPFEIAVKNSRSEISYIKDAEGNMGTKEVHAANAIMSSFNRIGTTWAGGSKALMTNVLRNEWGFNGVAISDFNLYGYMGADQGCRAGTDMQLNFGGLAIKDVDSPTARIAIRKSIKNMLYYTTNSLAMNGIAPGTIIWYDISPWEIWFSALAIGLIGISAALLCLCAARIENQKVHPEQYKTK